MTAMTARRNPCSSCPYRRDVPSGVWAAKEYELLRTYDGETGEQNPRPFACHQHAESLCSGWLACHDPQELLAIRLGLSSGRIDESVFSYTTDVPVFKSGAEAADHGMREIADPGSAAGAVSEKLLSSNPRRAQPFTLG